MFGVTYEEIAEHLLNIPLRKTDREKVVMAVEHHRLSLDITVLNQIVAIVKPNTVPLAIQGHFIFQSHVNLISKFQKNFLSSADHSI